MRTSPILLFAAVTTLAVRAQSPLFLNLDDAIPAAETTVDAVADFDLDGDFDLAGPGGIALNDGHGRFTMWPGLPLAFARSTSRVADLNGDGLPDVVSIDASLAVRIDLNAGGAVFSGPLPGLPALVAGLFATDVAIGDVDGDGDVDILISTVSFGWQGFPGTGPPELWLNDGAAGFTAAPPGVLPAVGAAPLDLRDLDADGDLDAVCVTNGGSLAVLTNTGASFTITQTSTWPGLYAAELGNFDGDAYPDLVHSSWAANAPLVTVQLGSASGFGPPVSVPFGAMPVLIQTLDLNGDGIDEVIEQAGPPGVGVSVHAVTAGGVGPATQNWPNLTLIRSPAIHVVKDLDGDLDRDVLVKTANGQVVALMNGSAGALVRVGGRTSGIAAAHSLRAGDVDGDGDRDFVGWGPGGKIGTGLNDGHGFFTAGPTATFAPASPGYWSLYLFDADGDGDQDLYVAANVESLGGGPTSGDPIWNATGGGSFAAWTGVSGTGPTSSFGAADFDGDGDQDVVLGRRNLVTITNGITTPMQYVQNWGGGLFASPAPIGANHATYSLEVADFDGNGSPDIFQANANAGTTGGPDLSVLYLNSGTGTFTAFPGIVSGFFTASGDLNGDGLADVVVDGNVLLSTGVGGLAFGPPLPSPLVGPAFLADLDGDGDLDLVQAPATVMFNAGGGAFGPPVSYLAPTTVSPLSTDLPRSFAFDADRDGDVDLATPGPVMLSNTTRQIARGSIARPGRPASIDLYGTPGGAWLLFGAPAPTQFPLPPWGTVFIDPASAQLAAMSTFTPAGTATISALLPNNPALVGWTTFWQAIDVGATRFTNRITITVAGY